MLTTILFDLDGTLLPMDNEIFTNTYFKLLAKKLVPIGYQPEELVNAVWSGTAAMVRNDGSCTNETAFWCKYAEILGERVYVDKPVVDEFYRNEFNEARAVCGQNVQLTVLARQLKQTYRIALATNPIFPATATENRIRWTGLIPEDFELYTTYENIGYCKPNLQYYQEILNRMGVSAGECLMVGNDVTEDMIARELGMAVFLLTDCLINKENKDISVYPHGGVTELIQFLEQV